ncbi:GNAT family N-acetyltransferase [Brachybacterium tyrofermentans]|uniref:GNAT family N-acetyltransferase n=1 Tax=Brachybacterium tyrofermentans TaxID=47848 RepID=UPI003F92CBD8
MDETSAGPGAVRLVHDDDRDRFEALVGDTLVGVLAYGDESTGPDGPGAPGGPGGPGGGGIVRDLRSTVVSPEHGGRGVGSALVRFALEDVRERGYRVTATCWFARGWIDRHPEYSDLLEDSATPQEDDPR